MSLGVKKVKIRSKITGKPYVPHAGQLAVHNSPARFRIAICGRRWGKTLCGLVDLLRFMIMNPNSLCLWAVPYYKHLLPVSEAIREWLPNSIVKEAYTLQKYYRYFELENGARCWLHSAEKTDTLRGPGLDFVVLEEAAQLRDEVWYSIIRPELIDSHGKALIISTPKGKGNWLYQEFLRAKHGDPEYECWQRPSSDRLSLEQLEEERKRLPNDVFRQEFLAEFVEAGGSVFRNVRNCFKGDVNEAEFLMLKYSDGMRLVPKNIIETPVYIGVDVGRFESFTVYTALDENGRLVGFERFRKQDFAYQKSRLLAFLEKFPNRRIRFDSRGIGSGFYEELVREGVYMEGINLTNPSKNEIIHNLIIQLDEGGISGPYIPELVEELESFSYHISSQGNVIYEAPENCYDDTVMSLALANSMLRGKAVDWVSITSKGYMEEKYK